VPRGYAVKQYTVKIDGRERVVALEDGRGSVDGVEAEVAEIEPGVYLVRRGAEQSLAYVDGTAPKLTVEIRRPGADPQLVAAELGSAAQATAPGGAAAQRQGGAPVTIRSPIPGRVVKVAVKPGDTVAAGQTTVVLEAMKMENELAAPRAGRIAAVMCIPGQAVESGQDLVTVE
jgi:biotin carboxyl carrier protein